MASNGSLANNNEVAIVQPEHALYCFDVLADKLHSPSADAAAAAGHLEPRFHDGADVYPLFVTWNIKPRSSSASSKTDWRLRGCIGNFGGLPLTKGLQEYALISALNDHRFDPIAPSELPRLQCGVSLLTHFEDCQDAFDWTLGVHGIWVHLDRPEAASSTTLRSSANSKRAPTRELSATFLPDVPPKAGWNQRQTLDAAIRKAGHHGRIDEALLGSLRVRRYQSAKVSVTYDEWRAARGHP